MQRKVPSAKENRQRNLTVRFRRVTQISKNPTALTPIREANLQPLDNGLLRRRLHSNGGQRLIPTKNPQTNI
jgi:hypothetical protein